VVPDTPLNLNNLGDLMATDIQDEEIFPSETTAVSVPVIIHYTVNTGRSVDYESWRPSPGGLRDKTLEQLIEELPKPEDQTNEVIGLKFKLKDNLVKPYLLSWKILKSYEEEFMVAKDRLGSRIKELRDKAVVNNATALKLEIEIELLHDAVAERENSDLDQRHDVIEW
jgi:hypothetical protein